MNFIHYKGFKTKKIMKDKLMIFLYKINLLTKQMIMEMKHKFQERSIIQTLNMIFSNNLYNKNKNQKKMLVAGLKIRRIKKMGILKRR